MIERPILFGKDHRLVGICTEPAQHACRPDAPAFLLLNAGLIHRVGPFRFYVDLARLLAAKGYTVFRFDLSGIGDSIPGKDNRPEHERIMADIADAMDMLESRTGIKTFVLSGLCWGADMSHDCAVIDSRVCGVVMMDTYGYPTFGFFLRDRVFPVLRYEKWVRFVKGRIHRLLSSGSPINKGKTRSVFNRQLPSKERVVAEIENLIKRDVRLLYIYSGGVPSYYNYGNQFWDMFKGIDFRGRVDAAYFKEADHLFTQLTVRRLMFDRVIQWMENGYSVRQSQAT